MLRGLVRSKQNLSQLIKFLHYFVYPFLTGFLLDLPWPNQLVISLAFVIASALVREFIEALLSLWQAIAVAGLFFVLVDYVSDIALNQTICAFSIPLTWVCILAFKRNFLVVSEPLLSNRLQAEIVGFSSIALLFLVVPRGQLENLRFLGKGEDSALYMWASSGPLRGQEFQLATSFGASSYLYFYNFLNNGFLYLSKLSAEPESNSLLIALNVLSNAWVFVLMSSILFSIRIVSIIRQKVSSSSSNLGFYIFIAVSSFLFFRASQDVGHFTQYLLNCAVLVFLISLITSSQESRLLPKLCCLVLTFATAVCIVGSYGPWLPMSIVGIALAINAFLDRSLIRVVFNSKYFFVAVLLFVFGWTLMLRKLYASSNLEMGGGVAVIPLEAVWLVFVLSFILLGSIFVRRFYNSVASPERELKVDKIQTVTVFFTSTLLSIAILDRTSFNQLTTLSFIVLIGLCLSPKSVSRFVENFQFITSHKEFDGVFVLATATFLYGLSIYFLSRFIGPIYDPMYAANKSMFTVFGQFWWLLILLFVGVSKSLSRFTQIVRQVTLAIAVFLVLGLTNYIRYDEVQEQWWHKLSLVALNDNPDALIACVNPILITDYEAYRCNHFMNVLTVHSYSARSLMGLSLGDAPVKTTLADWFNGVGPTNLGQFDDDTKVIVLSQDDLGVDALSIFEGVSENMIEYRVVGK